MEIFGMWILMFMFDGVQNMGRNLLIDVLKSDDDAKVKELAASLNADEEKIRQGIGSIKEALRVQAEKNGMSVEELIGLFK
jgi:hypothetical protein